jgi:hypothetical protein
MRPWVTRALVTTAAVAAALAIGTPTAQASTVVEAHVPFAFIVNGTRLPAGTYDLTPVWEIRNRATEKAALVLTNPRSVPEASASPQLDFTVVGGQHFLSEIVSNDSGRARDLDLTPIRIEHELEKVDQTRG